jgi:hypothetical protein
MITVSLQYVRSPAAGGRDDLRKEETIELPLLDSRSQLSRVLASGEIRTWARQLTGIDFVRAAFRSRGAHYRPLLKRGTDTYIIWIWKGTSSKPSPAAQYKSADDLIGTDRIYVRIEMMYGKGERPRSSC